MSETNRVESFITDTGQLRVHLDPDEVTWFDFLWFSRRTNAESGGWNNKSGWMKSGVEKLIMDSAPSFLKEWTKNSFDTKNSFVPRPRTGDFKFGRAHTEKRSDLATTLKGHANAIEDASENEINYALFEKGLQVFQPLKDVTLIGYEIPLAADSDGQMKVDLFGVSDFGIEIIELKQAKNPCDSPLFAFSETLCYGLQTLRCKEHILGETKGKTSEDSFKTINLRIVAPAAYWQYWGELDLNATQKRFETILKSVNAGLAETEYFRSTRSPTLKLKISPLELQASDKK